MAEARDHLSSSLKIAYATINNLNATCRKISAAKAFLLLNRDRVRHDMDSMMQRVTSRLTVMRENLDAELAEIVSCKTQYLENWEQLMFQNICKIGEVCIQTENALKRENERVLDRNAQKLITQLQVLCQSELEPDTASFFENSVKIEFIAGIVENILEKSTLGDLVTSGIESTNTVNGNKPGRNERLTDRERFGMQLPTADTCTTKADQCSKCQCSRECCQCQLQRVTADSRASNDAFQMKTSEEINKNEQLTTTGPRDFMDQVNNNANCRNGQTTAFRHQKQQNTAASICDDLDWLKDTASWEPKNNTPLADASKMASVGDSSLQNTTSSNGIDWSEPKNSKANVNNHMGTRKCDSPFGQSKAAENMNVSQKLNNSEAEHWELMNIEPEIEKSVDRVFSGVSSNGTNVNNSYNKEIKLCGANAKNLNTHRTLKNKESFVNHSERECWDDFLDKEIGSRHEHELKSLNSKSCSNGVQEQAGSETSNTESVMLEQVKFCDEAENELDDSFTSSLVMEATKKIASEFKKPIISGSVKTALKKHIQSNNNSLSAQPTGESKLSADDSDKTVNPANLSSLFVKSPMKMEAPEMADSLSPTTKKWQPFIPKKPLEIPDISNASVKQEKPMSPIKSSGSAEKTDSSSIEGNINSPNKLPAISQTQKSPIRKEPRWSPIKPSSNLQMTYSQLKQEMSLCHKKRQAVTAEQEQPCSPVKPPGFPSVAGSPLRQDKTWGPNNATVKEMLLHALQPVAPTKFSRKLDLSQLYGRGIHLNAIETIQVGQLGVTMKNGWRFQFPIGITVNHHNEVIVCDTGAGIVRVFRFTQQLFSFSEGKDGGKFVHPSAVVVNDNDDIFVKDDNAIYVFDRSGNPLNVIGKRCLKRPYGLVMTSNGNLVVVDVDKKRPTLFQFFQDGRIASCPLFSPLSIPKLGSKCRFLGLYNDKILVSDLGLSVMYLVNLEGELLHKFGSLGYADGLFNQPSGITVDDVGNWIVADSRHDRIQVFKPNGDFLCHVKLPTAINRPSDIHLTSDGHLYIVNLLFHTVHVYKIL